MNEVNSQNRVRLDLIEDGVVYGRCPDEVADEAVSIDIFVDGEKIATIVNSDLRDDFLEGQIADGHSAFAFEMPERYHDGQKHFVSLRGSEGGGDIEGSPLSFIKHGAPRVRVQGVDYRLGQVHVTLLASNGYSGIAEVLLQAPNRIVYSQDVTVNPRGDSDTDWSQVIRFPVPVEDVCGGAVLTACVKVDGALVSEFPLQFRQAVDNVRPLVVHNKRPEGFRFIGWVVPKGEEVPQLSLFIDGRYVESMVPSLKRGDISKLYPETRNSNNGFFFSIPDWVFDGEDHVFIVLEENSRIVARHSPIRISPDDLRDGLERRRGALLKLIDG